MGQVQEHVSFTLPSLCLRLNLEKSWFKPKIEHFFIPTGNRRHDVHGQRFDEFSLTIVLQARTQPKIYGGAKLIFQDLYGYIFVALKNFLAFMSAYCLQNSEKVKFDLFRACKKRRSLKGFLRVREKGLKFHATRALK